MTTSFTQVTIIERDGSHKVYTEDDILRLETVEGNVGILVVFKGSPKTVTFFPNHRIWQTEQYDEALG